MVPRQFLNAIKIDTAKTTPVMTTGGAQGVTLKAGGNVTLGILTPAAGLAAVQGGPVRGIAITSKERWPTVPDVPTTAELGYPTVDCMPLIVILGPPNIPATIVSKLESMLEEIVKNPGNGPKLQKASVEPFYLSSNQLRQFLVKEIEEIKMLWGMK